MEFKAQFCAVFGLSCTSAERHFLVNSFDRHLACFIFLLPLCGSLNALAASVNVNPNLPANELRQMRDAFNRERLATEAEEAKKQSTTEAIPEAAPAKPLAGKFSFELESIGHTPSEVLTEDEFQAAVAPWIGKKIDTDDISEILNAVNRLYRQKGYVVCIALVKPQRIRDGHLVLTLVEGKTDEVTIEGNDTTIPSYIENAFHFEKGKTANYQVLLEDLVRFNRTNDVTLQIDMHPGSEPMTTSYKISAIEPNRWGGTFFADSLGSKATGRARFGATITNRSVFGRRDAVTLLGMASHGNKSGLLSYALPLNSKGTKLTVSGSYSDVKVVSGAAKHQDVRGKSWMTSVRLEHPVFVSTAHKATLWAEASLQDSKTDAFENVPVADTRTEGYSAGFETLHLIGDASLVATNVTFTEHRVKDDLFEKTSQYDLLTAALSARHTFKNNVSVSLSGRWQVALAGDDLNSSDYFYLGHTSGVRGYDNDVISAESGLVGSLEVAYPIFGETTSLYAFADGGHLAGSVVSKTRSIYSAGLGFIWQPARWAYMNATLAFPLKRNLGTSGKADRIRGDITASIIW